MLPAFIDLNIVGIAVFVLVLAVIVWRDRENIEFHKILIIRRTDNGIEWLDRIADRAPRLWRWWSNIGVGVAVVAMVAMFYFLFTQAVRIFLVPSAQPAVGLVLPTTSSTASMQPGMFLVPFWYWIIGIGTVAVVHELMHGVIGRNEGFPIKSVGWMILGIIPGAFVEPEGEEMMPDEDADDEDGGLQMEGPWGEGSWVGKVRVLAAGSWANITVALLCLGLLAALSTGAHGPREVRGLYDHNGIEVRQVVNGSAADASPLQNGTVIRSINDIETMDLRGFQRATDNISLSETVTFTVEQGNATDTVTMTPQPRQRDYTYEPAPIDHLLVPLEQRYPGTIEKYERYNDYFVDEGTVTELYRWKWIRNTTDALDEKAQDRILELTAEIEPEPLIGISVAPVRSVKAGLAWAETPLFLLLRLLSFMLIIHAGVGAANMLPIKPLDGGWILDELLDRFQPRLSRLTFWVGALTVAFFLINLGVPVVL